MLRRHLRGPRATIATLALAFLTAGVMMFTASYSAFSATTSNASDNWSAGTVTLTDDDGGGAGSAMFTTGTVGTNQVNGAGMKPGQAVVNCLRVTYGGNLPATVKLYASAVSETMGTSTGMLAYLHIKIEEGTAGAFGCSGFAGATTLWDSATHGSAPDDLLSNFPTTYALGPNSALASWTNSSFRVYRFTMTLDSSVPDTSQGATATATFNWQARNS